MQYRMSREPYLYECLESALEQDYPKDKLTVYFCVASRDDPACNTIERVIARHSQHDCQILVEEEDPALEAGTQETRLGPNPKIRNMSRAYREAKGDLVWILDCNIWVGRGACGRMVDKICGFSQQGQQRPFKFVHHLPVAVDVPVKEAFYDQPADPAHDTRGIAPGTSSQSAIQHYGGRLDEAFLSSAHAKMYVAINTVAVAPCICGKSSMFRRSHLNALTNEDYSTETRLGSGIDYFSENICEDHLIGDLLWKGKIPSTIVADAKTWSNHGLVYGDVVLQPVSGMPISSYVARRVRWLRVRKFTVPMATLVEPGTESFLCSLVGAYGLTTLPATKDYLGDSWQVLLGLWVLSIAGWIAADWMVYLLLQSGKTVEATSGRLPPFTQPTRRRRPFFVWLVSWLGRETLTLPIWTWAIWGGVSVVWRDKKLWVGLDMKVHDYDETTNEQREPLLSSIDGGAARAATPISARTNGGKARQD
ncbi:Ceramide glucosyltransferase [Knufia fluminis]|uniref:Ceramide glucosyltransferase n=1 Tax=Knufia fluminis TaxID=191047 RepID=A0AAN8I1W1_9EURO|nr:Ceramide glucosyltransferase [Knufia fluminis]